MKTLSFVIPIFKIRRELVIQCLDSVKKAYELNKDFEAIVIDNGNTDDTYDWLKKTYNKEPFNIIRIQKNTGKANAIFEAIKIAKTKFYQCVDSDDWIDHTKVTKIIDVLKKTNSDFYVLQYTYFNSKTSKYDLRKLIKTKEEYITFNKIPKDLWHFEINVIRNLETIKKSSFVPAKGVNFYEDVYLNAMLLSRSTNVTFINESYYFYRIGQGGTNLSSTTQLTKRMGEYKATISVLLKNIDLSNKYTKKHLVWYLGLQIISYVFWDSANNKKILPRKSLKEIKTIVKENNKEIYKDLFSVKFIKFRLLHFVLMGGYNPILYVAAKVVKKVRK